jgi:hypothetical protein
MDEAIRSGLRQGRVGQRDGRFRVAQIVQRLGVIERRSKRAALVSQPKIEFAQLRADLQRERKIADDASDLEPHTENARALMRQRIGTKERLRFRQGRFGQRARELVDRGGRELRKRPGDQLAITGQT